MFTLGRYPAHTEQKKREATPKTKQKKRNRALVDYTSRLKHSGEKTHTHHEKKGKILTAVFQPATGNTNMMVYLPNYYYYTALC